jgi:hypothetical protein
MIGEGGRSLRALDPLLDDASDTSALRGDAAMRVDGGQGGLRRFACARLIRPDVEAGRLSFTGGEAAKSIVESLCTSTPEIPALSREFPWRLGARDLEATNAVAATSATSARIPSPTTSPVCRPVRLRFERSGSVEPSS